MARVGPALEAVDGIGEAGAAFREIGRVDLGDIKHRVHDLMQAARPLGDTIKHLVDGRRQRPVFEQVRENIRAIIATCLMERSMTKILFTDAVGIQGCSTCTQLDPGADLLAVPRVGDADQRGPRHKRGPRPGRADDQQRRGGVPERVLAEAELAGDSLGAGPALGAHRTAVVAVADE